MGGNKTRWEELAACAGLPLEYCFDEYESNPDIPPAMKDICKSCIVREACYNEAVTNKRTGFWAGYWFDNGKIVKDK